MECLFKGLDTSKCFPCQKCAGIEQLILQLGGSTSFALGFSRYAFRMSFCNKIKDRYYENLYNYTVKPESLILKAKYAIYKLLCKLSTRLLGDPYKIYENYAKIENRVFKMEFLPKRYSPIEYSQQAGKGYGFFFYWAAIGSSKSKKFAQSMFEYGKKIGTIVTLRDAIKDYDIDRRLGKYNPFHYMKKDEVLPNFQHNIQILQGEIQNLQNSLPTTIIKKIPKQNAFEAAFRYTMQSQSFCAKCSRESFISSLKSPATKTAASVLASVVVFLGINSVCSSVAASGGSTINSILQDETCCNRCSQNCAESCCQSCGENCGENCTCTCDSCTSDSCNCSCS